LKILVGYPERDEELTVVHRSLEDAVDVRQVLPLSRLPEPAGGGQGGLGADGASPRGPIALVQSARALALIHGRDYVIPGDLRSLVKDAFRHRLVLTSQALAEERPADDGLDAGMRA